MACSQFVMGVNDEAAIRVVNTMAASDFSPVTATNIFWQRVMEAEKRPPSIPVSGTYTSVRLMMKSMLNRWWRRMAIPTAIGNAAKDSETSGATTLIRSSYAATL